LEDSKDLAASNRSGPLSGGFSLASLALLITVVAVLLVSMDLNQCYAQLAHLAQRDIWYIAGLFGGAVIVGSLVGMVRLCLDGFSWRKLFVAPLGGCLAGMVGVLIVVSPGPLWRTVLAEPRPPGTTIDYALGAIATTGPTPGGRV
jgi:hypothetical protein